MHIEKEDIFGQLPGLNIYTQICLCYSLANDNNILHSAIIDALTNGLEGLTASFPWVAGQVVNEGSSEGNTGVFKIKPYQKIPPLAVKDLRHDPSAPTMNALRQAEFPFRMLDESVIAPRSTLPGIFGASPSDPTPILLVQVNFIDGGIIVTFLGQHQAMDMTGQGQIMHLLSKACHGESFINQELSIGNLARGNMIPLLDDNLNGLKTKIANQIVQSALSDPIAFSKPSGSAIPEHDGPTPQAPPSCSWAYLAFPAAALTALKSLATRTLPSSLSSGFVSTDDALSVFLWQSITRVRLPRFSDSTLSTTSTFARAVDVRRYLNVSSTYPGFVQNMAYSTYTLQQLVEEPLGTVASQLRSEVDPNISNIGYRTRALATVLDGTPDKTIASLAATIDLSSDIMLSSWAKVDCYDLDFNFGLGQPEAVRRPQFTPVESLLYLLPRNPDGEIAVAVCLRDEDMQRLQADEELKKHARFIV
ncbi:hypothetical protein L228DRAFT_254146 [Xylona heveae TC161]|uniref:Trichothecene 3-O-acetyltransferase-like N-terminal domain-containing protein n=1 Tax=Xylona heveae (strain CBS 132557 / TC161) TaxID=1328760 RepID=A0A165A3S3_XYLHT|nr:hypothetical protein L228DRAFT_254146 [Xylona heveae TC161]KZF19908.1 hypothetical protein L228DRAFT_254146 [Xylona heveae TC161]